ncbi:hypothetical protein U5922_008065 [Aquicoccus sp. G2-2]|nr:hypothetical protein [Aquicoccus sp. G2-2]MEA1113429.1 hypothetical protein [Aquicoccus sp. G2-2]
MTNKIAIWIGIIVLGLLGLDFFMFDSAGTIYLLRKWADLVEWLAFWR